MTNSNPSNSKLSNIHPEIVFIQDEAIVPIQCYDEIEQMTEQHLEIVFKQIERKRRGTYGIRDSV